jgi:8-oxo-dGTP diphosphatase
MKKGIDYIGVGIGAVILNDDGKVFLAKRGKKARNEAGKWECPGGGMRFGDTMQETIIREMQEEFGISVAVGRQLEAVDHLMPEDKQHWVAIAFVCTIKSGTPEIKEPEKCEAIGWFTVEQMRNMSLAGPTKHRLLEIETLIRA